MSFWLKVRSAIRAGDELLPPVSGVEDLSFPDVSTESGTRDITIEPTVEPVPPPVVVPDPPDPQDDPERATEDGRRYVAQVGPLFDLIGTTEGTDRGRGYDETLGYGAFDPPGWGLITDLDLERLDMFQSRMLAHPKNRLNSSACGRYQFIRTTLRALRKKWSLPDILLFNAPIQDDLAYITLVGRGLVRWRKGQITEDAFIDALSAEWASLPNSRDKGTYAGQRTGCTLAELRAVLAKIK